jgi:hypothetical protein
VSWEDAIRGATNVTNKTRAEIIIMDWFFVMMGRADESDVILMGARDRLFCIDQRRLLPNSQVLREHEPKIARRVGFKMPRAGTDLCLHIMPTRPNDDNCALLLGKCRYGRPATSPQATSASTGRCYGPDLCCGVSSDRIQDSRSSIAQQQQCRAKPTRLEQQENSRRNNNDEPLFFIGGPT